MQISALAYDDYIGRLGIGRVYKGIIKEGMQVQIADNDGNLRMGKVSKLMGYEGLKQVAMSEITSGDLAVISGIPDISIGETIGIAGEVDPMEPIKIEELFCGRLLSPSLCLINFTLASPPT